MDLLDGKFKMICVILKLNSLHNTLFYVFLQISLSLFLNINIVDVENIGFLFFIFYFTLQNVEKFRTEAKTKSN